MGEGCRFSTSSRSSSSPGKNLLTAELACSIGLKPPTLKDGILAGVDREGTGGGCGG